MPPAVTLPTLPADVLIIILGFLEIEALCAASATNRSLHRLVSVQHYYYFDLTPKLSAGL
jgi:hypothetical protein